MLFATLLSLLAVFAILTLPAIVIGAIAAHVSDRRQARRHAAFLAARNTH